MGWGNLPSFTLLAVPYAPMMLLSKSHRKVPAYTCILPECLSMTSPVNMCLFELLPAQHPHNALSSRAKFQRREEATM